MLTQTKLFQIYCYSLTLSTVHANHSFSRKLAELFDNKQLQPQIQLAKAYLSQFRNSYFSETQNSMWPRTCLGENICSQQEHNKIEVPGPFETKEDNQDECQCGYSSVI